MGKRNEAEDRGKEGRRSEGRIGERMGKGEAREGSGKERWGGETRGE